MSGGPGRRRVLWVVSELSPLASTGGLGEVAGALPPHLAARGWDVDILLPRYRELDESLLAGKARTTRRLRLRVGGRDTDARLLSFEPFEECRLHLLDVPSLFDRDGIYGHEGQDHPDNPQRFDAVGQTALELVEAGLPQPCLVHGHDWPAAPAIIASALRRERDPRWSSVRTLLTVHNPAYQGRFARQELRALEFGARPVLEYLMASAEEFNLLRGAWRCADGLNTVSDRFARELAEGRWPFGLDAEFRSRGAELVGILNGLDETQWDPTTDGHLSVHFGAEDLEPRRILRRELLRSFDLQAGSNSSAARAEEGLLLGFLGRLTDQKGLELILDAVEELMRREVRLVVIGDGDPELERRIQGLSSRWPDRFAAFIGFDRALSHRLLAGVDAVLIPSLFEPCGLVQMQAMRMGALCIAHEIGGLAETIEDLSRAPQRGTGFLFASPSVEALVEAVDRALRLFSRPADWARAQQRAMRRRWSWERGADRYDEFYRRVLGGPARILPAPVRSAAPAIPEQFAAHADVPVGVESAPTAELLAVEARALYAYWNLGEAQIPRTGRSEQRESGPGASPAVRDAELRLWREGRVVERRSGLHRSGQLWFRAEAGCAYQLELRWGRGRKLRTALRRTSSWDAETVEAGSAAPSSSASRTP